MKDRNKQTKLFEVTVCILTWNGKDMTLSCIASLFEQSSGIDIEIILVDNGSVDGTVDAVTTRYPSVRIIRNEQNEGFTLPNNQAIKASRGRYVLLLNNDTLLTENSLYKMARYMDKHPTVGVLGCKLRKPDGSIQTSAHSNMTWWDYLFAAFYLHRLFPKSRIFGRINMTYMAYETETRDVDWLAGAAIMVRSDAIQCAGMLDENIFIFSEDWEWCLRIKRSGWQVRYYSDTEITHLEGMSTHARSNARSNKVRAWSLLTTAASGYYVFSKLNRDSPISIFLYGISRRIFFLSKSLTYALSNIFRPFNVEWGRAWGYLLAAVHSPSFLQKHYLRKGQVAIQRDG